MGLVSWLAKQLQISAILNRYEIVKNVGKARPTDYSSLVERGTVSWAYRCATINAQSVAETPLRLYVRGSTKRFASKHLEPKQKSYLQRVTAKAADDVEELLEHPALELLNAVNPYMTGRELVEITALYSEITGNAYWYLPDGALGVPEAIWPLMSQYVNIVPDENDYLSGYLYGKTSAQRVAFAVEEVVHFRYPNPADYWYGLGPLQAAVGAIDRTQAMSEYQQAFYDNNARPDFAINVPAGTPKKEREGLYADWKNKFQGRKKSWMPVVLQGDMKIEPLGFSPSDATLIEAAKFSREEIANIFGIPMTMLEISSSRAEAEAQYTTYCRHTLSPRLRRMEQKLTEAFAARFDSRLFFAFDDPTPEDVVARLAEIKSHLETGYSTINEERALDGNEPVDWGDVPYMPGSLKPVEQILNPPEPKLLPAQGPPPAARHYISDSCNCPTCKGIGDGTVAPLTEDEARFAATIEAVMAKQRREVEAKIDEVFGR